MPTTLETGSAQSPVDNDRTPNPQPKQAKKRLLLKVVLSLLLIVFIAVIALVVWLVNSQTDKLIMQALNYALKDYHSEISVMTLADSQLEEWHIKQLELKVKDSQIQLTDVQISLLLDWPKSVEDLYKFRDINYLTQQIKHISTGDINVTLGPSLLDKNNSAPDDQGPAIALDISNLPSIHLGKTQLILPPSNTLPTFTLVMDALDLTENAVLSSQFSHAGETILAFDAQLLSHQWTIDSQVQLAPLQTVLSEISQRQTPNSLLYALTPLMQQWQALQIDLQGELTSHARLDLAAGKLVSQHQFAPQRLAFRQWEDLVVNTTPLTLAISGPLDTLTMDLAPLTFSITPNLAQQTYLLNQLAKRDAADTANIMHALKGLQLDEQRPVGLKAELPQTLRYPLSNSSSKWPRKLAELRLSTINSKIDTQLTLSQLALASNNDAVNIASHWALSAKQTAPLTLNALWKVKGADARWQKASLHSTGDATLDYRPENLQWQLSTHVINQAHAIKPVSNTHIGAAATMQTTALSAQVDDITQMKAKANEAQNRKMGDSFTFVIEDLTLTTPPKREPAASTRTAVTTSSNEVAFAQLKLSASTPLTLGARSSAPRHVATTATIVDSSNPTAQPNQLTDADQFHINLPAFKLHIERLLASQTRAQIVEPLANAQTERTPAELTRTELSSAAFTLTLAQPMTVILPRQQQIAQGTPSHAVLNTPKQQNTASPLLTTLNQHTLKNHLNWQITQLKLEKQLTSKGRSRKENLVNLDNLQLQQALTWHNKQLQGIETWQVGTVELESSHNLQFAAGAQPLTLTGKWQLDTSMTQTLALLNQLQPLPPEVVFTGDNKLTAEFNLSQSVSETRFAMHIKQSVEDLAGFYQNTQFEGGELQAQCDFTWGISQQNAHSPSPMATTSGISQLNCPQTQVRFSLFDPGFPLTDIVISADIALSKDAAKPAENWLQKLTGLSDTNVSMTAKGNVLTGQFLLPEFTLKLQDKSHAYLILQGMSLEEILKIQPQVGIYADGFFDGVLPVDLVNGKVSITGGQLAARAPGGLIAIAGNPAVDQMRLSQPYLDFAFSTLEHLQYSQLSSSFDMSSTGDAKLLVEIKGRSKDVERPIHLNYSHEENMLQLFRSLQIGNDLQDKIEKSVK